MDWSTFVLNGVSDVDDARSIELLLGGGHLTLFEREISKGTVRWPAPAIRAFLAEARAAYDSILIDSAPGLSMLTECWLREADFCLSPAKPDYLSTRGLQFLQQFGERDTQMGFSESLGIVISMKDAHAPEDDKFDRWLRHNLKGRCFKQAIPRTTVLQTAANIRPCGRGRMARSILARRAGCCGSLPASCLVAFRRAAKAHGGGENRRQNGAAPSQQATRWSGPREGRDAASCVNRSARP